MKCLAIGTTVALIIGVIILMAISPLIFKAVRNISSSLIEFFKPYEYSDIERAIICSNMICNWGNSENRARLGCPLVSPIFRDFCYTWLSEKGMEKEVCTLPSLLEVDPCKYETLVFPIKVRVGSVTDGRINPEKIKEKVDSFEYLIKGFDYIVVDKIKFDLDTGLYFLNLLSPIINIIEQISGFYQIITLDNLVFLNREDLHTYKEKDIGLSILGTYKIKVLEIGNLKEGEYYVFSKAVDDKYVYTAAVKSLPYMLLSDEKVLEVSIDRKDSSKVFRILLMESELEKGHLFVKADRLDEGATVYDLNVVFYDKSINKSEKCEISLFIFENKCCSFSGKNICFKLETTDDQNLRKMLISKGTVDQQTIYIPENLDFCEQPTNFWSGESHTNINFAEDTIRGRIVTAERVNIQPYTPDYSRIVFNYKSWKGAALNLNQVDKIRLCIKYEKVSFYVPREDKYLVINVLLEEEDSALLSHICRVASESIMQQVYNKWDCISINLSTDCEEYPRLPTQPRTTGKIGKIILMGQRKFSLDKIHFCKNC